jgi:hypothetical protein
MVLPIEQVSDCHNNLVSYSYEKSQLGIFNLTLHFKKEMGLGGRWQRDRGKVISN